MKERIIRKDATKDGKRIYFCWNAKEHPETYSEIIFDGNQRPGELIECPVCHKYHKITERM